MIEPVYKYQIAKRIGINEKTLYRRLKAANLKIPRGLIFPKEQRKIYEQLGFTELWKEMIRRQEAY